MTAGRDRQPLTVASTRKLPGSPSGKRRRELRNGGKRKSNRLRHQSHKSIIPSSILGPAHPISTSTVRTITICAGAHSRESGALQAQPGIPTHPGLGIHLPEGGDGRGKMPRYLKKSNDATMKQGWGPRGALCRHCDFFLGNPSGKGMNHCVSPAFGKGEMRPWRSWHSCGAYSGLPSVVKVKCPDCKKVRNVLRCSVEQVQHSVYCHVCGRNRSGNATNQPRIASVDLPEFEGCFPIRSPNGRCIGFDGCPSYSACLVYAAGHQWEGWKEGRS